MPAPCRACGRAATPRAAPRTVAAKPAARMMFLTMGDMVEFLSGGLESVRAEKRLDLRAAADAGQAPCDEVLAVVGEEAVAIFAEARAGTRPRGRTGKSRRRRALDLHWAAVGEFDERDFLDRSAVQPGLEAGVVNDAAVAGVETVMHETPARRRQVRSDAQGLRQGRLGMRVHTGAIVMSLCHRAIARAASGVTYGGCRFQTKPAGGLADDLYGSVEDITGAALGDDELRMRRVWLDLAAQAQDLDVDGAVVHLRAVHAREIEQLVAR